ncbi:helix-turn-helix domain-containing protein [Paraburkholderia sp. J7]|uniref:helix-turn-helix domain-containing protein n=1 Tax=Paraburkholderia sp. J7 TaxID=2805438 RepID=UPI002AB6F6C0|nr:helix-turn-helix domain-containing protein [Paraburkholderia sp. J7]
MSFDALRSVAAMTAQLGPLLPVALTLADMANPDGLVFPSIAYLCAETGLCRSTVKHSLRELRANGFLVDTEKRVGQTGQIRVYKLSLPPVDALRQAKRAKPSKPNATTSAKRAASRPVKDSTRGQNFAPFVGRKGGNLANGKGVVSLTERGPLAAPGISKSNRKNQSDGVGSTTTDSASESPTRGTAASRAAVAESLKLLRSKVIR